MSSSFKVTTRRPSTSTLIPSILGPSRIPSNSIIASSHTSRPAGPQRIVFPSGWGGGELFEWYRAGTVTNVRKIQLAKETLAPYFHEYILVTLHDSSVYRIDRRPDPSTPIDTIVIQGSEAIDTIEEILPEDFEATRSSSTAVACIELSKPLGLDHVLFVCYSIQQDDKARRYTLQRFNCYFLSWTIITSIFRYSFYTGPLSMHLSHAQTLDAIRLAGRLESILDLWSTERSRVNRDMRRNVPPAGSPRGPPYSWEIQKSMEKVLEKVRERSKIAPSWWSEVFLIVWAVNKDVFQDAAALLSHEGEEWKSKWPTYY